MFKIFDDKSRLGSLILLLFAILYLNLSVSVQIDTTFGEESFSARTMPIALASALIMFSLLQLLIPLVSPKATKDKNNTEIFSTLKNSNWRPVVFLILLMAAYSFSFEWLGFLLGGILFIFFGSLVLGESNYVRAALIAFGLVSCLWMILTQIFGLFIDPGDLVRTLFGSPT